MLRLFTAVEPVSGQSKYLVADWIKEIANDE